MIFFPSLIDIDYLSCYGNCGIPRASGWEGDCLWESVWLCSGYGVPHYLLLCSLGGAGDEVRTRVSPVLNFLTPRAGPHCGLSPDGEVQSGASGTLPESVQHGFVLFCFCCISQGKTPRSRGC